MSTTFLEKSQSAGNRQTWTMSMWIKTSVNNDEQPLFSSASNSDNQDLAYIEAGGNLRWWTYQSAAYVGQLRTSRVLRDANAWYHLVFVFDSTNATADDRMRIYINGVQETSFAARNNPAQNSNTLWNGTLDQTIGLDASGGYVDKFDGSMSHIHFIDGTAYDATAFGQYDANGVWTIKTSPSVTYGTNGFFILKDGNSVTDQSGNSNNFTVQASGTLTKTEDSPSNVFDTINTNFSKTGGVAGRDPGIRIFIDNGATRLSTDVALWTTMLGSIPMFSGKYYWECKRTYEGSPSNHLARVGIEPLDTAGTTLGSPVGTNTDSINYQTEGGGLKSNSSYSGTYDSWQSNNDIVQIAVDMDNHFIYFGKNGIWQNSGDPTSGSSGTGGIAITPGKGYVNGFTVHRGGGSAGGDKSMLKMNFGNGYFQTTAVASAGTNASGNGIFEYDVPTGYTALSTKGLNL